MKQSVFFKALYLVLIAFFLYSCGSEDQKQSENKKAKIVEITQENTTNNNPSSSQKQIADKTNEQTAPEETTKKENVFEGTFVDASVLDMSYYYFFKDKNGKEVSFYYNPQKNNLQQNIPFLTAELSVNKDLIGKKYTIKYTTEKREDDYTGEMTTFNIPIAIEELK